MAAVEPSARSLDATSSPVIPGIEMSSTMTSGRKVLAASSACRPSFTAPTTVQPGVSAAVAHASIISLSSTSNTRVISDEMVLDGMASESALIVPVSRGGKWPVVRSDRDCLPAFHDVQWYPRLEPRPIAADGADVEILPLWSNLEAQQGSDTAMLTKHFRVFEEAHLRLLLRSSDELARQTSKWSGSIQA
jgi:hypothetical protein